MSEGEDGDHNRNGVCMSKKKPRAKKKKLSKQELKKFSGGSTYPTYGLITSGTKAVVKTTPISIAIVRKPGT